MKILTTQTVITNTIYVDDELVEGMSEDDICAALATNPEYFGVDSNPHVDGDFFVSIEDYRYTK